MGNYKAVPEGRSPEVNFINKRIVEMVSEFLSMECNENIVNLKPLNDYVLGIAWSPIKKEYYLMNTGGELIAVNYKDAGDFCSRTFGELINYKCVKELYEISSKRLKNKLTDNFSDFISGIRKRSLDIVLNEKRYSQHLLYLEHQVCMFKDKGEFMYCGDNKYLAVRNHLPFVVRSTPETIILDDYKIHFPKLDLFIDFLIATRFASDRKNGFLWLKASSDWGKGFLASALASHGLVVEMSAKEVESIFEGKPCGKTPQDFYRAWTVIFNEFKNIKPELKQLENRLFLSPKNQLQQNVQIFAKLFLSADGVESLTGEHGVDPQFANRFSYWSFQGSIKDRKLFHEVGKNRYMKSVSAYLAIQLNRKVNEKLNVSEVEARNSADEFLNYFHNTYNISKEFGCVVDNIEVIGNEFISWCLDIFMRDINMLTNSEKYLREYMFKHKGSVGVTVSNEKNLKYNLVLTSPKKVFEIWNKSHQIDSQQALVNKMMEKILYSIGDFKKKYHIYESNIRKTGLLILFDHIKE